MIPESLKNTIREALGHLAHPLRGVLVGVPDDWEAETAPLVSVQATPSGAPYPRRFDGVPWAVGDPHAAGGKPSAGDFVALAFKGGSSEFPIVVAYYPGTATTATRAAAQAPRPSVPTAPLALAARPAGPRGIP